MENSYKNLTLPVSFGDYPIIILTGTKEEITKILGPCHVESESLAEPAPYQYWAIGFDCGLEILIAAYETPNQLVHVMADSPESEHILKHLESIGLNLAIQHTFGQLDKEQKDYYFSKELRKSWERNSHWQLWRQDDNGNQFLIAVYSSERAALCAANTFESLGHKQTYWVKKLI